jgi:hypothetical protein
MTRDRWDETWHRLQAWTNGQAQSERLAAQILLFDGYGSVDPSHPLGGPDGGKDILCTKDGLPCLGGVYFPRGHQSFKEIKKKFRSDLRKAEVQQPPVRRFIFITNQELRLGEREELASIAKNIEVELYHLERITAILDSPGMHSVRAQFLGIEGVGSSGGRGGSAYALGVGSTAIGGQGGRSGRGPGGDGGHSFAVGVGSTGIGGSGGDAPQLGGGGGRGGRGPTDRFGFSSENWGVGRGGRGARTPEFNRVLQILIGLYNEYLQRFRDDAPYIEAGLEQVPTAWFNQRLVELGERWWVDEDVDSPDRTLRPVDE